MIREDLNPQWIGDGSEENEIYKENILDHYKHPHNFGNLQDCTIKQRKHNPLCGDNIEIYVKLEKNNVTAVKFAGNGCAISMAAASLLTDYIKGKSLGDIKKINDTLVLDLLGIPLGIVRIKCGMLCLNALLQGIREMEANNAPAKN